MKKMVVVINGPGGVGKDTLISAVAKKYVVDNYSSVDVIKGIAYEYGWGGEKTDKARAFLHDLKNAFAKYNGLPQHCVLDRCRNFVKNDYDDVLFVHIREPEEIRDFVARAPCEVVTLLIDAPFARRSYGNYADDNVHRFNYDLRYYNSLPLNEAEPDFVKLFDGWFKMYSFDSEEALV